MSGKLIVIDGADGTGKSTQVGLLVEYFKQQGQATHVVDFPRYDQPSAWFVTQYLNGKFGGAHDVDPYQCSVFYALDRFAARNEIRQYLAAGDVVISNRYVTANMGHQGGKIADERERAMFFDWLDHFEYEIMGLPRPLLGFILHMPVEIAQDLIGRKEERSYIEGDVAKDLHEQDLEHLKQASRVYQQMAQEFDYLHLINCMDMGRLMTPAEVHQRIVSFV